MPRPSSPIAQLGRFPIVTAALALACTVGCQKRAPQVAPSDSPVVPVSHPVERSVIESMEYTGRTDAVQSVSVRARVTGYLNRMPFTEGDEVKAGDLLFEIDPRPYQALVDQAQSQVTLNKVQLELAQITFDRDKMLVASNAVSQQQLDQDRAGVDEAKARIKVSEAALKTAKLNLSFTQVRAPVGGRVSRYYYTVGNLVTQDQTLLTTIVSMDPIYAYFDVEERTFQRLVRGINTPDPTSRGAGPRRSLSRPDLPVTMALEGEKGFPHKGTLNFINNQVNPSTGTVAVRAVFANPHPEGGAWQLVPGMFVRVRLPVDQPHPALLVVDRAVGSDQGLKFVYVVDAENKIQYRRVTTGPLEEDGLRVIEDGLKPDDWVVVGGLQQMRPKAEVRPDRTPMPTLAGEAPTPSRGKPQPPPGGGRAAGKGGAGKTK